MANFKASARSVDMLGRQQIAGIPNAINEIFKNAYDAYASETRVDYLEHEQLLFIRDNGFGMTRDDFEKKWLTLGTDSKAVEKNIYIPDGAKNRHVLGEKGIGRLSIATIGSSVLVVTRAKRGSDLSKIVTSYICWPLFEIPGINIDKIPVPIVELDEMPNENDVTSLVDEIRIFYEKLKAENVYFISESLDGKIRKTLSLSTFSPRTLSHQYINSDNGKISELHLDGPFFGTHFYIPFVDPILSTMLSKESFSKKDIGDLQKQLLGFYPSFLDDVKPVMNTSFYIYREGTLIPDNIIGQQNFFSDKEYKKADHHFEGRFDENGTFDGKVSIYGKLFDFKQAWKNSNGRKPKCGPFKIRIGFFQGKLEESSLSPMEFSYYKEKLDRIGGLYIYKENVRVLPYGDNDVDFLKLEKQRTLSATYYKFSLRRFIGAILLTNKDNVGLQEKAGREGFSKNQAYYDFVSIIQDFLESLLAKFLREKSNQRVSDVYLASKADVVRQHLIQKAESENIEKIQKVFEDSLREYRKRLDKQKKNLELKKICTDIENFVLQENIFGEAKQKITQLESYQKQILEYVRGLEHELTLVKPNASLGEDLHLRYNQYISESEIFLQKNVYSIRDASLKLIEEKLIQLNDRDEQERKIKSQIDDYIKDVYGCIEKNSRELEKRISALSNINVEWKRRYEEDFLKRITESFKQNVGSFQNAEELIEFIKDSELAVASSKKEINRFYSCAKDDLKAINKLDPFDTKSYSSRDALIAQGEQLLNLKKQLDGEFELFQLGTAISIIHHEFGATADSLKHAIKDLGVWANANQPLMPLYQKLSNSYLHLENYLKLFTPLSKRTGIKKVNISGKEIFSYIQDLFEERAAKESVKLVKTSRFEQKSIQIGASVILPVFINIVDNSLFWLKSNANEESKEILFDVDSADRLIICDNGPGFQELSDELIFTRGFSTKPGGRGLGLFITKQILNESGFDICTTTSKFDKGAGFVIFEREVLEK